MSDDTLLQALKDARSKETAHLEAIFRMKDVSALRLTALYDRLLSDVSQQAAVKPLFNLDLDDAFQPRLWLDLNSSIVMEPDPKTYRLVQVHGSSRDILFETQDDNVMRRIALRHLAFNLVAQSHGRSGGKFEVWPNAIKLGLIWLLGIFCGVSAMVFLNWR